MHEITIHAELFRPHLPTAADSTLLQSCLHFGAQLLVQEHAAPATAWDPESRRIERLKMSRPRAAAQEADTWLEHTLNAVRQQPQDEEAIGLFASALSTWAGVQRTLGQLGDATLAAHHALGILCPQVMSTRAGFASQRAAYVLGDLGAVEAGLELVQQAVTIHQHTPGGYRHVGTACAGVGAYQLFYRRAFAEARAAFTMALHALPNDDEVLLVAASHGVAYSYLMEGQKDDARESVRALRQLRPEMAADQDLRLRWLEAEIAAASGDFDQALKLYDELFERSLQVTEPCGHILVSFDAAQVLLSSETSTEEWARWHRRIRPIVEELTRVEQAALEPYLDALAGSELDRELLDQTTVAFKRASNRMLLGMGRTGAAGRPERCGQFAA